MSVLIKGMEMPKEGSWKTVRIYPDGTCAIPNWQGDCTFIKGTKAVPIPPHGDLVERNALLRNIPREEMVSRFAVSNAPTIIEAEGNLQYDSGNANNSEVIANSKAEEGEA